MCSKVLSVAKIDLKNLSALYLQVDMEFDHRKNAAHGVLNMLSRDLLHFCEPLGGCLCVPEKDMRTIFIIIQKEHVKNKVFLEFLKEQKISIKQETSCDNFAVEKCLEFSIFWLLEKMNWFRVGNGFVNDGFLDWKETRITRIQSLAHCSPNGKIFLKFSSEIIKIYPFEHMVLDADERFVDLSSGPISHSIRHRWVSCLPKLGKGKIVRVHRKIPDSAPFETYVQMKSYWRKVYGYNLPVEEPEVYYDVMFNNGQTMLYPMTCVLTANPEAIPMRSTSKMLKEGLEMFLKIFREAEMKIFGIKMDVNEESNYDTDAYLDCMAMIGASRIKQEEKKSRKIEIPKVYPKIPAKRSASGESSGSQQKKRRLGCSINFE